MPNAKHKRVKRKHRKRSEREKRSAVNSLAEAKVKTINKMFREGTLPNELYERVTVKKNEG